MLYKIKTMKRILFLTAILSISMLGYSQQDIEVTVSTKTMSKGSQMAITVFIPEAKVKDVIPLWKKYVNNRGIGEHLGNLATQFGNIFRSSDNQVDRDKLKVEKKGDEWYVRSIEEESVSTHSIDVYARASEADGKCMFSAFFQYTDSVFVNEENEEPFKINNFKTFIRDFGVEVYINVVDEQIKEAGKDVKKEKSKLDDIESNTRKEEKSISKDEVDIQEYNANIAGVENDIKILDQKIESVKTTFSLLSKEDLNYETSKAELKELQKQKSKSFKKIKSMKGRIKSNEGDIKSSKGEIAQNDLRLKRQQLVIDEKESIVEQLEKKKAGIR